MTQYEITYIIISVIGLFISCISIFISVKSNIRAKNAIKLSQGQIELDIHQLLNQTKKDVMDVHLVIAEKCIDSEFDIKEILLQALNTAMERNLNAYEEACAKYLDDKVDKERFKKNYHVEIRRLVEDKNNKEKFDPTTSVYKAILKVYDEWNNLEK